MLFIQMNKINGIGPKTAFQLANTDSTLLQEAIESMNVGFFQRIPGV
jgi:Holliday junction resolvasome RuvABC DNA-binding subunit